MIDKKMKLTPHFTLEEVVNGMLPEEGVLLNWKFVNEEVIRELIKVCGELEKIRSWAINERGQDVKIAVISGFRCLRWEHARGRSGASQHVKGRAIDWHFAHRDNHISLELMSDIHTAYYHSWRGGLGIKHPTYENGNIKSLGFIHIDTCNNRQRHTY